MDILITVCSFVYLFVRLRISLARIKLAASNFSQRFMGVLGRESPILGNFTPPARSPTSDELASHREVEFCKGRHTINVTLEMCRSWNMARRVDVGGMCGYRSVPTDVLVFNTVIYGASC